MSNKILVKQSGPTVFQNVGPTGTRPSFMDMARTSFAPRGQVGVGQRLRGLVGMAGKGAAAAATAQQTAERMQAGDVSAPLQAGITYQGIDPTGTISPKIGERMYKPGQPQALPTPPNPAGMQPNTTGQRGGTMGVAPNNSTFTSPIDMSQYPSVGMPATQPQVADMNNNQFDPNQYINQTQQLHENAVTQQPPISPAAQQEMMRTGQQSLSPINSNAQRAMMGAESLPPQYNQEQINNNTRQAQLNEFPFTRSFVGTLFDKLGPDMVYKMTPHEIGAVSALMYLKLS